MPDLILLAACEKVIVAQGDSNATLVALLANVGVSPRDGAKVEIPHGERPTIPLVWDLFSVWRRVEGEEDQRFIQKAQMVSPSGFVFFESNLEFDLRKKNHRLAVRTMSFPAFESGTWFAEVYLKKADEEDFPLAPAGRYPIDVEVSLPHADEGS